MKSPIDPFLKKQGTLILDGGLATELEARGYNLSDSLWSARLLADAPQAIKEVHLDYLEAGADCIISASYQATIQGFLSKGFTENESVTLLQRSVLLAQEARDEFWSNPANHERRLRPLVAASVGPYGAYLADGSEYRGNYALDEEALVDFHRRRWQLLVDCAPDLMACETIPSIVEASVLQRLLEETPGISAWISFCCQDGQHIGDGTPLVDCIAPLDRVPEVVAVGINCTAPRFIRELVREARRATQKPIIVYPNSGETYDAEGKRWIGHSIPEDFAEQSRSWRLAGATLLGGCCRTGPKHIRHLRAATF